MKLKLEVVKGSGGSWDDVTEHGLLKTLLAKTDKLAFSQKNLDGDARVCIFVTEQGADAPKMLSLSARLSKIVRKAISQGVKKMEVLKSLLAMRVIENVDGIFFLIPDGKQAESFSVNDLLKGEAVTLEDLVA